MKKLSLLLLAITMVACTTDEEVITQPDCDCDRVVQVYTFNVIGTPESPGMHYFSNYTTINDCTQIQREKTFNTTNQSLIPKLNQCR